MHYIYEICLLAYTLKVTSLHSDPSISPTLITIPTFFLSFKVYSAHVIAGGS